MSDKQTTSPASPSLPAGEGGHPTEADWLKERRAFYEALVHEGAEVVERVTTRIIERRGQAAFVDASTWYLAFTAVEVAKGTTNLHWLRRAADQFQASARAEEAQITEGRNP